MSLRFLKTRLTNEKLCEWKCNKPSVKPSEECSFVECGGYSARARWWSQNYMKSRIVYEGIKKDENSTFSYFGTTLSTRNPTDISANKLYENYWENCSIADYSKLFAHLERNWKLAWVRYTWTKLVLICFFVSIL